MRQQLTQPRERLNSYRPAKQRRALLESNPPRDSWIERRRNKNVSTFGEAKTSPNAKRQTFISEPEHALKTHRPRSDKVPNGQPISNGADNKLNILTWLYCSSGVNLLG